MVDNALSRGDFGEYPGSGYPLDHSSWSFIRVRLFHTEAKMPAPELLPPFGRETALSVKTIDEDRGEREHHHQPLRQIHLSRTEICLKKRSHP
jgi:hypothetical protein